MGLDEYRRKRDFTRTREPEGDPREPPAGRSFVVQRHAARREHYDLRLEMEGVLKSWAVPKGPSLDPRQRRMAVEVEDHPLDYGTFEGRIPKGSYGAGTVMVWDRGRWEPVGDPVEGHRKGNLKFRLFGERLGGEWALVRPNRPGDGRKQWLLIKKQDPFCRPGTGDAVLADNPTSILTARTMDDIAQEAAPEGAGAKGIESTSDAVDPSILTRTRRRDQPEVLHPQLATRVEAPPDGGQWLSEIKYDGYRGIAVIAGNAVRLQSRNGRDITGPFEAIARELAALPLGEAILDGEIVAMNPDGTTDFQSLQNILKGGNGGQLAYCIFDLPFCQGFDLTRSPLHERKDLLRRILSVRSDWRHLRYSDHIQGSAPNFFQEACRHALEGIVSKIADAPYVQKRTRTWLKTKCRQRGSFVVSGFTRPSGSRERFGALLLGRHDDRGRLVYAGRVGTGFDDRLLRDLSAELTRRLQPDAPFVDPPKTKGGRGGLQWTHPDLVAEVAFGGWTRDGLLRHAVFMGIRRDKVPREVVMAEQPAEPPGKNPEAIPPPGNGSSGSGAPKKGADDDVAGIRISHPDRVLYPESGIRKLDLARYYAAVADWILPHLVDRPLLLLRCPEAIGETCFFQKHLTGAGQAVKAVTVQGRRAAKDVVVIRNRQGLMELIQLGVLEIHPWGCRVDKVERPDRMTFDLDPGSGVQWDALAEAARLLHAFLKELGLESFVKTSGGKGLHVVVPLVRRQGWEAVRSFAGGVARALAGHFPERFVATMTRSKREGKIFIDHFRNSRGATSVAPFSARARPGAAVSTPVFWDALRPEKPLPAFDIRTVPGRLETLKADPWAGFFEVRQSLTKAMLDRVAPLRA